MTRYCTNILQDGKGQLFGILDIPYITTSGQCRPGTDSQEAIDGGRK